MMGTRLSISWKGRGTQEGTGERGQVTLRERTVLFVGGKTLIRIRVYHGFSLRKKLQIEVLLSAE